MADPNSRLYNWQINNINKIVEKMMEMDFSNIVEVKELRKVLIEEVQSNIEFHIDLHDGEYDELHDCKEYESRNKFGNKMLRILDETIRELENEEN